MAAVEAGTAVAAEVAAVAGSTAAAPDIAAATDIAARFVPGTAMEQRYDGEWMKIIKRWGRVPNCLCCGSGVLCCFLASRITFLLVSTTRQPLQLNYDLLQ